MFERDGQALYFGATAIENIFLTEFMPSAKGDFVKVYLAAVYHCAAGQDCASVQELARELGQTPAQVEAALRYWERRGALSYIAGEKPVYRLYSLAQRALTGQDAAQDLDEDYIRFTESVYALFGDSRKVRPAEIALAYEWVVDDGLSQEAVLALLDHQKNTAGVHFSFRKAGETAARMRQEGVVSAQDAESYLGFEGSVHTGAQSVLRRLGKRRLPSEEELALYRKWIGEWQFTPQAVLSACRETTAAGDPTFKYLDGILARLRRPEGLDETGVEKLLDEGGKALEQTSAMLSALGVRANPAAMAPLWQALHEEYPQEIILIAARECALADRRTLDDLNKLLDSWRQKNLDTPEKAEAYIRSVRELDAFLRRIYEACGHRGGPTAQDRELLTAWRADGFPDGVILLAARQAAGAEGRKMAYIRAVLARWKEAGVRTEEDALRLAAAVPDKAAKPARQVAAQRYTQREYNDAELEKQLGVNDLFKGDPA